MKKFKLIILTLFFCLVLASSVQAQTIWKIKFYSTNNEHWTEWCVTSFRTGNDPCPDDATNSCPLGDSDKDGKPNGSDPCPKDAANQCPAAGCDTDKNGELSEVEKGKCDILNCDTDKNGTLSDEEKVKCEKDKCDTNKDGTVSDEEKVKCEKDKCDTNKDGTVSDEEKAKCEKDKCDTNKDGTVSDEEKVKCDNDCKYSPPGLLDGFVGFLPDVPENMRLPVIVNQLANQGTLAGNAVVTLMSGVWQFLGILLLIKLYKLLPFT